MNGAALAALVLWFGLTTLSLWIWLPAGVRPAGQLLTRTPTLVLTVTVLGAGLGAVAFLASVAPPLNGRWIWLSTAVALAAAVLMGGAVTRCLLALADASSRSPTRRVSRTVLQGGAWIGALERLALAAVLLLAWPEGVAVIVAVKSLARFPEIRAGQGTGAAERFLIGTFASLGSAAACAGVAVIFQ